MRAPRVLLAAHPALTLLEAWLGGAAIFYSLARLIGFVQSYVFGTGLLFLCGTCGMWVVLRTRLPAGTARRQLRWEASVGLALSLAMLALSLLARPLGLESVWDGFGLARELVLLVLALTGPGYLIARGGVRLWLFWDRLRRRRMLWALAHAHLTLVVLAAAAGTIAFYFLSSYSRPASYMQAGVTNTAASLATRLILAVFPTLSLMVVVTILAIAAILPPSALFSYLVARQTTRRLERLATAAAGMQNQDYSARVNVEGDDEVAQVQSTFNSMADHLERTLKDLAAERDRVAHLLEARQTLVASVSHELRTPVATTRAVLESALGHAGEALPPALQHDLEVMNHELARLQALIDDLFTLARAEAGGLALACCAVDLGTLLQRAVDAVAPLAWNGSRVAVLAELPDGLPPIEADPGRVEQMLANLLRNAIRHTAPGGIVVATARQEGTDVILEVRDTGEGIAAEELPHVWERFYRGENIRGRDEAGAGLGLALVKELAEAMGGSVAASSVPGEGSCFGVRLRAKGEKIEDGRSASEAGSVPGGRTHVSDGVQEPER